MTTAIEEYDVRAICNDEKKALIDLCIDQTRDSLLAIESPFWHAANPVVSIAANEGANV